MALEAKLCKGSVHTQCIGSRTTRSAQLHCVQCYISRLCFRHVPFCCREDRGHLLDIQRSKNIEFSVGSVKEFMCPLVSSLSHALILFPSPIVSSLFPILHLINLFHPISYCFLPSFTLSMLLSPCHWHHFPTLSLFQSYFL